MTPGYACVCALRYRLACLSPTVCTAHTAGPHSRDCFVPTACLLAHTLTQKHSSSLSIYYLNNSDAPVLHGSLSHPVCVCVYVPLCAVPVRSEWRRRKTSFPSPFSHPTLQEWGTDERKRHCDVLFISLCLFCWSTCAHAIHQIIYMVSEQRIIGIK